jgi:uncharacterized protein involved in outer membrane biogenesis
MAANSGSRILRRLLLAGAALLLLLVVLALVVSLVRIPIDVSPVKGTLEAAVSQALGREVEISGEITVTTSLWPAFQIEQLRVANPGGFAAGELARLEKARLGVSLMELLQRRIHLDTLRVEGLTLDLVRGANGAANWAIGSPASAAAGEQPDAATDDAGPALTAEGLAVDELAFDDIALRYTDEATGETQEFLLEECDGSAARGERMQLAMKGSVREEPFDLQVEASSLADFLAVANTDITVAIEIAGVRLRFEGTDSEVGDAHTRAVRASAEGERLDSLNQLLALDLPPLEDFRVAAELRSAPGKLELNDLEVRVRESVLEGTMVVDRRAPRPKATLALVAKTVQLDDFDLEGWSPEGDPDEATGETPPPEPEPADAERTPAKMMSPEALGRADLKLTLEVGKVLNGDDILGRGQLELALTNGRITLKPLQLETQGGKLLLEASLKPDTVASEASLRVLIQEFDFGILVRRLNPETDLGGTLSMDIDVQSSARDVADLLRNANGYIDVAGQPVNLEAGVVDLWAVNLLASVVTSADEEGESEVNCLISRWSMEDGVLRADNLAVDTSKIRICGSGEIDFRDEEFDLVVAPTAKQPEFFSLATPLSVTGDFEGFEIGMRGGAVGGTTATAVRFVISPVTVPVKRLIQTDLPSDGADVCSLPIGPHEGNLEPLPGCGSSETRGFFQRFRSGS